MQMTNHIRSCSSGFMQSVPRVCRASPPTPAHNVLLYSRLQTCSAIAKSLHSVEQGAVALSVNGSLPTASTLQQSYATAAVPEQPQRLPTEIKRVLFSEQQIRDKVAEMAAQICRDYKDRPLAIIGVLNGAFIFTSDLVREVSKEIPNVKVDFMKASSYGAASESSGAVQVQDASNLAKWEHYNILLVEDIIDSGHTLARLSSVLRGAGADTVKVVALLDKKGRRRVECFPDYVGWECPNEFVVGYGLDFNECFRCLPYVAALKEEAYEGSAH